MLEEQNNVPDDDMLPTELDSSLLEEVAGFQIPNHETTKCSIKRNGIVKSYSANTN
jgi:hypothetical protein